MTNKKLNILQVNTLDIAGGGGASKIAWNFFEKYNELQHNSYLAVGCKQVNHKNVFEIPKHVPCTPWQIFWFRMENKTQPFLGKIKGFGLLKRFFHSVAWPQNCVRAIRGSENFCFSGTKKLLHLAPQKPDILHLHNLHNDYFDLRMLPFLSKQIPTVLTLHDAWLLSGHCAHSFDCKKWLTGCGNCPDLTIYPAIKQDSTKYNWKLKTKIYSNSKLYVATPCQWLMNKVDQSILKKGIVQQKVIHNGINLSLFTPAPKVPLRKKLNIPTDAFVLLFAGQAIKSNLWKDYKTLEKAVHGVAQNNPEQKILLLCLGDKAPTQKINKTTIRFIPYLQDQQSVTEYFQLSDLYIHPAKADTFPNTVLEALACGVPVIGTKTGGIPEQIRDIHVNVETATGIVVQERKPHDLASAITQLLHNQALRKQMSINARNDVITRFDLNKQTEKYLDWYKEILCHYHSSR